MPKPSATPERPADLRQRALSRLTGSPPPSDVPATPMAALEVLYELASSPATAPDALALLHELQVHQVELELQNEELRASRGTLEATLERQAELYNRAPVGLLTLDGGLVLHELNPAAERLLGAVPGDLAGRSLTTLLSPRAIAALTALLAKVTASRRAESGEWPMETGQGVTRVVHATADLDAVSGRFLLALVDPGRDR